MTSERQTPRIIEAPDTFYLGARIDPEDRNTLISPIYYDSADLTTHAVLLGMTGSGKTGLAMDVIEEAALDGIPQLIIDPKGDMTNLLLSFPELSEDGLAPWMDLQTNGSKSRNGQADARQMAKDLQKKRKLWGITSERIQAFNESSQVSIFTPGIDAGLQISLLSSFEAPADGWEEHEDKYRQKLSGIVTAILSLIGVDARPLEDPEHVLLANIFEYNWSQGLDLTVEHLIHQVQEPPFDKLGVLDVDRVISAKARRNLAEQLNNIIAAPTFQSWLEGMPLQIPRLLFTEDGSPRTSVFYLAHLDDAERQFFITLLLESVLAWMHTLTGAPSLRALLYIDEVYGLFPPAPHNPPTKDPIMRLLKQARALGIGLMMATQNTKDIDYKGLSNAGTWFIGKLLTDGDRRRVMEGIETGGSSDDRALDLATIKELLGNLNTREFIRYNIHDSEKVILMKSRQTMSYIRGPLNPGQIRELMADQKTHDAATQPNYRSRMHQQTRHRIKPTLKTFSGTRIKSGADERPVQPLTRADAPVGFAPVKPDISDAIDEYYLPVEFTPGQAVFNWQRQQGLNAEMVQQTGQLLYQPGLLAEVNVRYSDSQTDSSRQWWYAFIIPKLPDMVVTDWGNFMDDPFDPDSLSQHPYSDAYYGPVPKSLHLKSDFNELENRMVDWIYKNLPIYTYHNPDLNMTCGLQENPNDFLSRVHATVREKRDEEIAKLVDQYDRKYDSLERQIQRKRSRLEAEEEELDSRKQEELVSGAESAWRLLRGSVYRTISRVAQLRRRSSQTDENIEVLNEDLGQLLEEVDETEQEMENDLNAVRDKWKRIGQNIEEKSITAYKKDINTILFGIVWVPYWVTQSGEPSQILPATSSLISQQQDVITEMVR